MEYQMVAGLTVYSLPCRKELILSSRKVSIWGFVSIEVCQAKPITKWRYEESSKCVSFYRRVDSCLKERERVRSWNGTEKHIKKTRQKLKNEHPSLLHQQLAVAATFISSSWVYYFLVDLKIIQTYQKPYPDCIQDK